MTKRRGIRIGLPRLGDLVEYALKSVGVTEDRVARWLGRPCGCEERKIKLNALSDWANRKLGLDYEEATRELEEMTKEEAKR